jgi:uncharacterized radical SAM superfamily protein
MKMRRITEIYSKIEAENASWRDYSDFLELNSEDLDLFFKLAQKIKFRYFGNKLKIYIPNKRFPAISITGDECALKCEHCNEKYLKSMKPILNKVSLEKFLINLYQNGGTGALISGGCEPNGTVPLYDFLDSIKKVKAQTNLIINTHTGLLNEMTAKKLAEAKIDIVSFDINMDEEIVSEIYHLRKNLSDYEDAVKILKKYKLNIVPHLCVGLYYGRIHKELQSIKFIKESGINPSLIVIIALIPPKQSKKFLRPKPIDIAKVIALIRYIFPKTEISLGCMRPRGDIKVEVEKLAIKAGITRIEIPSSKTLSWLKHRQPDIKFGFYSACCAIPQEFEKFTISNKSEIKRYLKLVGVKNE